MQVRPSLPRGAQEIMIESHTMRRRASLSLPIIRTARGQHRDGSLTLGGLLKALGETIFRMGDCSLFACHASALATGIIPDHGPASPADDGSDGPRLPQCSSSRQAFATETRRTGSQAHRPPPKPDHAAPGKDARYEVRTCVHGSTAIEHCSFRDFICPVPARAIDRLVSGAVTPDNSSI